MNAQKTEVTFAGTAQVCEGIVIQGSSDRCAEQKYRFRIEPDDDALHPFEDDEDILIVSTMRNYNFGNTNLSYEDLLEKKKEGWTLFPIYGYSHGGLTLSSEPYSCHWDSGQAGWIAFSKEFEGDVDPAIYVKSLDDFVTGDVWALLVIIDGGDDDGQVDECIGGIYSLEEARSYVSFEDFPALENAWEERYITCRSTY